MRGVGGEWGGEEAGGGGGAPTPSFGIDCETDPKSGDGEW